MPIFRGIEIVVVSSRKETLPEYPHPDGSSVRLVSIDDARSAGGLSPHSSIISADADPTRQKKMNPRISVYVPSIPGDQFWLKYNIIRSPPQAKYLYFKMFMNGRNVISWGIPTSEEKTPISGNVVRALYEPSERRSDGVAEWRSIGIESRYFHFMPGLETRSAAEDGGLIEIQVFRSRGRKRRLPKMTEFRNQERYGIVSPSGGLIENPQDATYYDWLLVDPKDEPYGTFCFHYRSMKHLVQLNLILHEETTADPSMSNGAGSSSPFETTPEKQARAAAQFAFGLESLDDNVFNDERTEASDYASVQSTPEKYFLKSPPALLPAAASGQPIPQPSKAARDAVVPEVLKRPLPDPPRGDSRHSSRSSLRSNCPSLTPSLAHYVDSGDFGDDEVDIGTAQTVVSSAASMIRLSPNPEIREGDMSSLSDYDNSPPSTIASRSPELHSPKTYLSTTGSVLERHIAQFASPIKKLSPHRKRRIPSSASESTLLKDYSYSAASQLGTLKLTESEWMRHTPSPIQRKPVGRLWSPRLERKPSKSELDESRRRGRYSDLGPRFSKKLVARDSDDTDSKYAAPESSRDDSPHVQLGETTTRGKCNTWDSCRDVSRTPKEWPNDNWI